MKINMVLKIWKFDRKNQKKSWKSVVNEKTLMLSHIGKIPFLIEHLGTMPHQLYNLCHILGECQRTNSITSNIINKLPTEPLTSPGFLMFSKEMSGTLFGNQVEWIFGAIIKANHTYQYIDANFRVTFDTYLKDCLVWVAYHRGGGGEMVLTSATTATTNAFPDDSPKEFRHHVHQFLLRLYGLAQGAGL